MDTQGLTLGHPGQVPSGMNAWRVETDAGQGDRGTWHTAPWRVWPLALGQRITASASPSPAGVWAATRPTLPTHMLIGFPA